MTAFRELMLYKRLILKDVTKNKIIKRMPFKSKDHKYHCLQIFTKRQWYWCILSFACGLRGTYIQRKEE